MNNSFHALLILILFIPAACESEHHASLTDTYWKLVLIEGAAVNTPEGMREAHLILVAAESRAHGFSGCNNFFGSYQADGQALSFSALGSTRMACPESMQTERAFFQALGKTTHFKITGQTLRIYAEEQLLARLEAVYL